MPVVPVDDRCGETGDGCWRRLSVSIGIRVLPGVACPRDTRASRRVSTAHCGIRDTGLARLVRRQAGSRRGWAKSDN
eukprot:694448-Prymnesium_polylepis.2